MSDKSKYQYVLTDIKTGERISYLATKFSPSKEVCTDLGDRDYDERIGDIYPDCPDISEVQILLPRLKVYSWACDEALKKLGYYIDIVEK